MCGHLASRHLKLRGIPKASVPDDTAMPHGGQFSTHAPGTTAAHTRQNGAQPRYNKLLHPQIEPSQKLCAQNEAGGKG